MIDHTSQPRSLATLRTMVLALLSLPACVLQCGDNSSARLDGGADDGGLILGDGSNTDAVRPLTSVDFSVGGCANMEPTTPPTCTGQSPLRLTFAPLTSAPVQVFLWNFGDGNTSSEASPFHTFLQPGLYSISLDVEGAGGGFGVTKTNFVIAAPAPLGAPCTVASDCESATCLCNAEADDCRAGLAGRGICTTTDCLVGGCEDDRCVDLGSAASADPEPWQTSLCLPSCDSDNECEFGLQCQAVLDPNGEWAEACVPPGLVRDLGAPCRSADGALDSTLCASGLCIDVGAQASCAFDCSVLACPVQNTCATFNGALGSQCLRDCDETSEPSGCSADPWIGCESPGNPGALGFTTAAAPLSGLCGARFCDNDPLLCGVDGTCNGSHCQAD